MVILPFGQRAFLAEVGSLTEVMALHRRWAVSAPAGVIDLVPAARTVLVTFDPALISPSQVRAFLSREADADEAADAAAAAVELDIVYDGPDLQSLAERLGVSAGELVAAHRDAEWTVAFTGFAPGFGYLTSPDWPFEAPRRESPRTRVPVGAVGLAGEFSGAYPRETPGGWQLIGTTSAPLFDPDAAQPALLAPGTRVRFVQGRASASLGAGRRDACAEVPLRDRASRGRATPSLSTGIPEPGEGDDQALRILAPGLLATIQDLGRPGRASLGVAPSGALDRTALRTANRLLGNPESAAAIEVTMGGFRAEATRDLWFSVTGAWGGIRLDGTAVDPYQAHPWRAGAELELDWFAHGARAYLAVRGGVEAQAALGSRSTDLMAGLGPAALTEGTALAVGAEPDAEMPSLAFAPWGAPEDEVLGIELAPGPRADWFTPAASAALFESEWTVSHDANRVGIRLEGPALPRLRHEELPSEGMLPGALQVPPSGRPVILGADGPVTGGYPVIAVVAERSLDLTAQARPGTRIRFRHAPTGR